MIESNLRHLDLLYQRTASELGLAKESQVRELLRAFAGQTVDGALFGSTGQFVLPAFTRIEPVSAADSSWEVDALAEAEKDAGERWAVAVKWRNRRADYHDIVRFYSLTLDLHARCQCLECTRINPGAPTPPTLQGCHCCSTAPPRPLAIAPA